MCDKKYLEIIGIQLIYLSKELTQILLYLVIEYK